MTDGPTVSLSTLSPGSAALVVAVEGEGAFRMRLMDMGFTKGALVRVIKHAPFGDPIEYCIGGTHVTLRVQEAKEIIVQQVAPQPYCPRHGRGGRGRRLGRGLGLGRAWRTRNR
ncbi:MAG: FeoA family protein [Candidatus Eisenbacteria bacterium]